MVRCISFFIFFIAVVSLTVTNNAFSYSSGSCSAMNLVKEDKWSSALKCAKAQNNSLLVKVVLWSKYKDRRSDAKTEEILRFVSKNPNFPDTWSLQSIAESKINSKTDKAFLKKWFRVHLPVTDKGIKYYLDLMGNNLKR